MYNSNCSTVIYVKRYWVIHVTLLKPGAMQNLGEVIETIQLKVQSHLWKNTDHCFTWAIISNTQKIYRPGRTCKH